MRRVGELQDENQARTFHDVLVSRGIGNNAEQDDDGTFSIWVHDDDQITEAARLFALFRTSPDAPEFRDATAAAKVIRAQLVKSEGRRRSAVVDEARVGYERNFAGGGMITILLVVLTVAITVYAGFMRSPSADRAMIDRLHISQVPFTHATPDLPSHFLPEVRAGEVWRLITPIFLHGDFMHIIFNMMWLAQFGKFIESRFGGAKLLALVMVIGVGSNLVQYVSAEHPYFGGMSGVNYGLFGFLWMKGKFGRDQNWQMHPQTVQLMLMWMVLCFTGLLGPIANGAHVGGLVIGALLGFSSARLVPWLERESR
ncbi:MAG: rhomboid family intramembrane serine protease [Verrucomicrobia bacterium]|nr:rhomboid family intramembrane serine protease [Verrucomicrobiota bacterium]